MYTGGRAATFEWTINDYDDDGEFVQVPSDLIPKGSVVNVLLQVSVWYSNTIFNYSYNITKSNEPVPSLSMQAISSFDEAHYQSGIILLAVDIEFEFDCDNSSNDSIFNYEMEWIVYKNGVMLNNIETTSVYTFDLSDLAITIDKEALSVGYDYDFQVNMQCNNGYFCDISKIHSISYQYSDLICQIANGNKYISGVTVETVQSHSFTLDGETFSYDPDNSDYKFEWKCTLYIYNNSNSETQTYTTQHDCGDSVFSDLDNGVTEVSFENEVFDSLDSIYVYEFEMTMYDSENDEELRDPCVANSILTIENLISNDDISDILTILDVSITATRIYINSNEKLRLIADIDNENINYNDYIFDWSELNGYLTQEDIYNYQINDNIQRNYLVLDSDILTPGNAYEFQVNVSSVKNNEYGKASISIFVGEGPSVVDGSFDILPDNLAICNGSVSYYSSLEDVFTNFHDISIDANGDHLPLFYRYSLRFDSDIFFWLDSSNCEQSFMTGKILFD